MCKVYTGYHGTSVIEHGLCACTVDNPLAKARGLSLRTGAQTMLYLSHITNFEPQSVPLPIQIIDDHGPIVQSSVTLTKSLVEDSINLPVAKHCERFCNAKTIHIFRRNFYLFFFISFFAYITFENNVSLINDTVSFEQPDPEVTIMFLIS